MRSEIKTSIICGGVVVAAVIVIGAYLEQPSAEFLAPSDRSGFRPAPDLAGISGYINAEPERLREDMRGKVVLYDIWTYSCINCVRTLPFITAWDEKYSDQGLVIVGIHTPEFEFEKDANNVQAAVDRHGIRYPVVLDNDRYMWDAFGNHYWPRKYVADHLGLIRYDHIGEGAYQETERVIQQLLKERAAALQTGMAGDDSLVDMDEFQHAAFRTPEIYLGYQLAFGRERLGNPEGFRYDSEVDYTIPEDRREGRFYMGGTWRNGPESMTLISPNGEIYLSYMAKEVNLVASGPGTATIYLDGEPIPDAHRGSDVDGHVLHIGDPGLYNIITSETAKEHEIILWFDSPGVDVFTFTFG